MCSKIYNQLINCMEHRKKYSQLHPTKRKSPGLLVNPPNLSLKLKYCHILNMNSKTKISPAPAHQEKISWSQRFPIKSTTTYNIKRLGEKDIFKILRSSNMPTSIIHKGQILFISEAWAVLFKILRSSYMPASIIHTGQNSVHI